MRQGDNILNYKSSYTDDKGVLNNKLGIHDNDELNKAERMITSYKLTQLYLNPGDQTFDVNHYLRIHKYLFDDIYPFAGTIRLEVISKRITFCLPHLIETNLKQTLDQARKRIPAITDRQKLLAYITELYSDLDIIHPFREGNGRTEREFIRQLIDYICKTNHLEPYYIDYRLLSERRDEYIDAVVKADAYLKYEDLYMLFDTALTIKEPQPKKEL